MKYILFGLVFLLLATNAFWAYNYADMITSLDHSRSSYASQKEAIDTLLMVSNLLLLGQNYNSVLSKMEGITDPLLIKKRTDAILVGPVVLIFERGLLTSIKLLRELTAEEFDYVNS